MSIKAKRDMDPNTGEYIGDVTFPGVKDQVFATKAELFMFAGFDVGGSYVLGTTLCLISDIQIVKLNLSKVCYLKGKD